MVLCVVLYGWCVGLAVPVYAFQQDVQTVTIQARVIDKTTQQPIPGASVRVGAMRGGYASNKGLVRIALPKGSHTAVIMSLGYERTEIRFSTDDLLHTPILTFALKPSSVLLEGAQVFGDISPEEVIRRAIAQKKANQQRIKTSERLLYSKIVMNNDFNIIGMDDAAKARSKDFITETFSRVYERSTPTYAKHTIIEQRRQTANLSAADNLTVLDQVLNLYDENVQLLSTKIPSPIADNALSSYDYKILERKPLGDRVVYILDVRPSSSLYPGFEGTIQITDKTYMLVGADIRPSASTAIKFFRDLHYVVKYDQFGEDTNSDAWLPTYQIVEAKMQLQPIKWLAEIDIDVKGIATASETRVNHAIPDSIFAPVLTSFNDSLAQAQQIESADSSSRRGRRSRLRVKNQTSTAELSPSNYMTVIASADSTKPEFWEKNALTELSEQEKKTYQRVDSVVKNTPEPDGNDNRNTPSPVDALGFRFGNIFLRPLFDYTRVTGRLWGVMAGYDFGAIRPAIGASYSTQGRHQGFASLSADLYRGNRWRIDVEGLAFSRYIPFQQTNAAPESFSNIGINNLLFQNNFDFFREDGWALGIVAKRRELELRADVRWARQFSQNTLVENSRINYDINDGNWRVTRLTASWNYSDDPASEMLQSNALAVNSSTSIGFRLASQHGQELGSGIAYNRIKAFVRLVTPTFSTGYDPMYLRINVRGGLADDDTPRQGQFFLFRRFSISGSENDFVSVPINQFAGTRYIALRAEHSFGDLWWRFLRLPTFDGRGIDLIGIAGTARYLQRESQELDGAFRSTNGWYSEAGFGVARIPSIISDIMYFRFDSVWGIGNLGAGNWGWNLSLSIQLF
jgi:hypothetical protein